MRILRRMVSSEMPTLIKMTVIFQLSLCHHCMPSLGQLTNMIRCKSVSCEQKCLTPKVFSSEVSSMGLGKGR